MSDTPERPLRIAVAQYAPRVGDPAHNLAEAVRWARAAAEAGADLVVLPELASSGYTFASEAEAEAGAESAIDGPTVGALAAVCAPTGMHVVV